MRTAIADLIADEDYGPDALADDVGQSRRTLFRRVEELLGLSPMELIWRVRLDTAAQLLDQKAGSVSEIALRCRLQGRLALLKEVPRGAWHDAKQIPGSSTLEAEYCRVSLRWFTHSCLELLGSPPLSELRTECA